MPPTDDSATAAPRFDLANLAGRLELAHLRWTVAVALAVIAFATPGFVSWPSIVSLLTTVSFIGCVAVGMTMITISGNIMSFSLGATQPMNDTVVSSETMLGHDTKPGVANAITASTMATVQRR